jgi:hypothetical protein
MRKPLLELTIGELITNSLSRAEEWCAPDPESRQAKLKAQVLTMLSQARVLAMGHEPSPMPNPQESKP